VLPHPRMALRRFVLAPACEVASEMIHPSTGWTIARLLQRLEESPHYVAIVGVDAGQTLNLAATAAQITGAHLLLDPLPSRDGPDRDDAETRSGARELQVIAARLEQLSRLPVTGRSSATDWYIGNYWLPQSLALAQAWLDGAARRQVERACTLATQQAPLPHCVVFLAPPTTGLDTTTEARGTAGTLSAPRDSAAVFVRELSHQVSRPNQGPVCEFPAATCSSP